MKCSEIRTDLAIYCDGSLGEPDAAMVRSHLEACPLCRQRVADVNEIRTSLRQIRRPEISNRLRNDLKIAVRTELNRSATELLPISSQARDWLLMRLMPYAAGVFASITVGSAMLAIMLSGMLRTTSVSVATTAGNASYLLAGNRSPFSDSSSFISPVDFSRSRMAFSSESPSVNPQGALVALTKSMVRGEMKDEEVAVVADVFANGLAQISEVVESPSDQRTMDELERAFRSGSSASPFVPAVMENRPGNMRIVLKLFKSVDVAGSPSPRKRRS